MVSCDVLTAARPMRGRSRYGQRVRGGVAAALAFWVVDAAVPALPTSAGG